MTSLSLLAGRIVANLKVIKGCLYPLFRDIGTYKGWVLKFKTACKHQKYDFCKKTFKKSVYSKRLQSCATVFKLKNIIGFLFD